ncbi:hypothetical protein J437_LFUL011089 [Ladona fulva]|uniref:ATP-dependent DNA helicase n=1 Tax=Ladona fulva TaxID=123851 RepID=A0A8K0K7S2_LADFU|nr:hypothetical protein J437_LFUL011089 [Ladona fulva]
MQGGRTAHSALKLPLNIAEQTFPVCNCKVVIWNECIMAHKKSFKTLNTTLQDPQGNSELMGGALVIIFGDFRQTLPVIAKSTPADEINAFLKQ